MTRSRPQRSTLRLAALLLLEGGVLTALALRTTADIAELLVLFGVAFLAYATLVPLATRTGLPVWSWFLIAVILRGPWLPVTPTLSDDIWRYLYDGRVQLAGVNPYRYPPTAPEVAEFAGPERSRINHPELRTIYPPGAQLAFRLAAAAGGTVLAWKLLVLLADLAIGLAVLGVLRARGRPGGAVAAYLLHPLPIIEFAGNGHVDVLGIALLITALLLIGRRPAAAGAALGLSIVTKYVTLPLVPFFARGGYAWKIATSATLAVGIAYLPFLNHAPFGSLLTFARTFEFNGSIYPILATLTSPAAARWLGAALVLAVLTWLWRARARPEPAAFWLLAALLLLSPIVHPWYVTWLIPFLAWRNEPWALVWSGTVALSYLVLPDWRSEGVWHLPAGVTWLEYVPVWLLLGWRMYGRVKGEK